MGGLGFLSPVKSFSDKDVGYFLRSSTKVYVDTLGIKNGARFLPSISSRQWHSDLPSVVEPMCSSEQKSKALRAVFSLSRVFS